MEEQLGVLKQVEDLFSAIAKLPAEIRDAALLKIRAKLPTEVVLLPSTQAEEIVIMSSEGPTSDANGKEELKDTGESEPGNASDKVQPEALVTGRRLVQQCSPLGNFARQPIVRCRRLPKRFQEDTIIDDTAKLPKPSSSTQNAIEKKRKKPKAQKDGEGANDKFVSKKPSRRNGRKVKKSQAKKDDDQTGKTRTPRTLPWEAKRSINKTALMVTEDVANESVGGGDDDDNDESYCGLGGDTDIKNDGGDDDNGGEVDDPKNHGIPMRVFKVPSSFRQKDVNQLHRVKDDVKIAADDAAKREQRKRMCYGCVQCPRNFLQRCHLVTHMRTHTGEKPYVCFKCKRGFTQGSALSIHMQAHDGVLNHECPHCEYRALRKIDMLRHVARTHSTERNFVCDICSKSFTTNVAVKEHVRNVHERTSQHMCHLCGYVTHRADNLQRHLRVRHSKCEKHECPVCGRLINQRGTFLAHLRTHTGERPHVCSDCDKAFKSHSQLASHMLTHGVGTFQCDTCERFFKTRFHLQRHAVVHTGEKPYSCPHCAYACNVTNNLNKHVRAVHGIFDYSWGKTLAQVGNRKDVEGEADENDLEGEGEENTTETTAKEKGKAAAAHFLSKMSLRKAEGLTVSGLRLQLEAKQQNTIESNRKKRSAAPAHKSNMTKRKKKNNELNDGGDLLENCEVNVVVDQINVESPDVVIRVEGQEETAEYIVEASSVDGENASAVLYLIDCTETAALTSNVLVD